MIKELKREDIDLSEWEFEFKQRNAHPPLMADWWLRGINDYFASESRLAQWNPDYLITSENKGYIKSAHKKAMLASLREKSRDHAYLAYIFERTAATVVNLEEVAETVAHELKPDLPRPDLQHLWDKVERAMHQAIPWFWLPYYLSEENIISDRVKEGLESHRPRIEAIAELDVALVMLITPVKEPSFHKEQRHFNRLVAIAKESVRFQESPDFLQQATEYLAQHAWMSTYFVLPLEPLSMEELIERVRSSARSNTLEEFAWQETQAKGRLELIEQLQNVYKGDQGLEKEINIAQELGWALTASVEGALAATAKLIPFYKRLAVELGVPYEHLTLLTSADIQAGLGGASPISQDDLDKRAQGYVACLQRGEISWMWGSAAKELAMEFNAKEVVSGPVSQFSGRVAFKGKVTARACVADTAAEANAMADGGILVTTMTTPDYVPAMKRSGAIVTDEGGLLCHAAIMSREFGKPCVIATKIATQVIKTGDVVEVDANAGVVRIIERK